MRKLTISFVGLAVIGLTIYAVARWRTIVTADNTGRRSVSADFPALPPLDAGGVRNVRTLTKSELIDLMTRQRPLSSFEEASINRGCPGLACLYQGLGLTKWPESARGTRSYLHLEDALNRICSEQRENFIFLKQAWWTGGKSPTPNLRTGEVPLSSVTRAKPGWYTFNYAVYFPTTKTYVWINHREYGFPLNLLRPMKAYLSLSPPPLDENRPAQLYCSTCR